MNNLLSLWICTSIFFMAAMTLYMYTISISTYNAVIDKAEDIPDFFTFKSVLKATAGSSSGYIKTMILMLLPGINLILVAMLFLNYKRTYTSSAKKIVRIFEFKKTIEKTLKENINPQYKNDRDDC